MRRALRFKIGLIAVLAAATPSVPSVAYNDDGHFYTIIAASRLNHRNAAGISPEEAVIAAFCAQMPDMARELDATTLRVRRKASFFAWGAFSACIGREVRHMVNVHEYLHALTDSAAAPVTDAAVKTIQTLRQGGNPGDPNRACAVGFALHLLGDSFAHRRLKEPAKTYPPGLGHVRDVYDPDYIALNSARANLWIEYTEKLADALELKLDPGQFKTLKQIATDNLVGADPKNIYNQDAITATLIKMVSDPPPDDTRIWAPYSPRLNELYAPGTHLVTKSFEEVVAAYRSVLPAAAAGLDFNKTWSAFMNVVVLTFSNNKIVPACPRAEPLE